MKLAVYKKTHQGFSEREIREFKTFPNKAECGRLGLIVSHPLREDLLKLYATKKYNPLQFVEQEER